MNKNTIAILVFLLVLVVLFCIVPDSKVEIIGDFFEKIIKPIVMGKRKYLKIPMPKWTWWQTTIAIFFVILAFRLKPNNEIIQLLKEFIKLWSG